MDIKRITVDMPVELNEAVNEAVKRTTLSKAQYIRMALEVMNLLAGQKADLLITSNGIQKQIFIPGVLK